MSVAGAGSARTAAGARGAKSALGAPSARTAAGVMGAKSAEEVLLSYAKVSVWAPKSAAGMQSACVLLPPKPYQQAGGTDECDKGGTCTLCYKMQKPKSSSWIFVSHEMIRTYLIWH